MGCGSSAGTGSDSGVPDAATSNPPPVCARANDGGWLEDGTPCDAGSVCSSGTCLAYLPAAHGAEPQFTNSGGGTLTDLHLVTVTFQGYPYRQEVEALGNWLVTSDWLQSFAADYGPINATNTNVEISTAAPSGTLQTSDVESFLSTKISAGTLPGGPNAAGINNHLYVLYYPADTAVSFGGGTTCTDNLGFHYTNQPGVQVGPSQLYYAVIPDCDAGAGSVERTSSHEVIEAVTDPTGAGYALNTGPWSEQGASIEVADVCEADIVSEAGFVLSTAWSNSAAAAGLNPCIPWRPLQGPYLNVNAFPASQTVAAGQPANFDLVGFASAPASPWPLTFHLDQAVGDFLPAISGTATTASIANGLTFTVSITPPPGTPSGSKAIVWIQSGTPPVVSGVSSPIAIFQGDEWPVEVTVQ